MSVIFCTYMRQFHRESILDRHLVLLDLSMPRRSVKVGSNSIILHSYLRFRGKLFLRPYISSKDGFSLQRKISSEAEIRSQNYFWRYPRRFWRKTRRGSVATRTTGNFHLENYFEKIKITGKILKPGYFENHRP